MPATDQQLRAIAFLASACRPIGCKQWDESGIYANLAKVRDRSLGTIAIAAIQAAEDRNATTPGVIPTAGPHWRAPDAAPTPRQTESAGAACVTCGEFEPTCRARWNNDHQFVAVERTRGQRSDEERERVRRMTEAIKGEIQPLHKTDHEPAATEHSPAVDELRDIKASALAATDREEQADA